MKHLKMFKEFHDEVENHCNKKIKNLWFDHKGRYLSYKFLAKTPKSWGIVPQTRVSRYTIGVWSVWEMYSNLVWHGRIKCVIYLIAVIF